MPIYEYYSPDTNTIYQFYAKTLAQGKSVPRCPDNPRYRMQKVLSTFAITGGGTTEEAAGAPPEAGAAGPGDEARMEAAMGAMESEFAGVDENDPKAMARMMRRMSDLTGEKIEGEMEEVVRKLEEGADPDSLEDQMGGGEAGGAPDDGMGGGLGDGPPGAGAPREPRHRFKVRRPAPRRDPKLYDYE